MKVTFLFNNHLLCPAPAVQSEGTMAEVRRLHQGPERGGYWGVGALLVTSPRGAGDKRLFHTAAGTRRTAQV